MTPVYMPPSPSVNVTPHELPDRHFLQLQSSGRTGHAGTVASLQGAGCPFKVPPPPVNTVTSQKPASDVILPADDMSGVSDGCGNRERDSMASSSSSSSSSSTSSAVSSDSAFCETPSNTSINTSSLLKPHHHNNIVLNPTQKYGGQKVPRNAHVAHNNITLNLTHSSSGRPHSCDSNIVAVKPPIGPLPLVLYPPKTFVPLTPYTIVPPTATVPPSVLAHTYSKKKQEKK